MVSFIYRLRVVIFISASVVTINPAQSATINYGNQSNSNFDFLNIHEVSAQNTFLGGDPLAPSSTPVLVGNTLVFNPSTSLQVSTSRSSSSTGNAIDHASTEFSFDIKTKGASSIDQLKIDITGTYNLFSINLGGSTLSTSVVSMNIPMTLQVFGANRLAYPSTPTLGFNLTVIPNSVTASSNGIGNVSSPSGIWTGSWNGAVVDGAFTKDLNKIFNIPSMQITELSVTITPDLTAFRSISDQNSSSVFLTNASFALIPEPSISSLLGLGLAGLLARRRRSRC